jgi:hypothetical protein
LKHSTRQPSEPEPDQSVSDWIIFYCILLIVPGCLKMMVACSIIFLRIFN